MSEVKKKIIDFRKLKDEWKAKGEIPIWYSTNALQFFMNSYSYEGESVRSRDSTTCKYLAKYAPHVKPEWWDKDPYTKGKDWEEVFFNLVYTDGFAVFSTPLKANGGIPERGMTVSCSGQTLGNSISSKSFIRGELEQLIKNSHGCSISVSDWLSEGDVYDSDGNMSEGIMPILKDFQKVTEEVNQRVRRGQTAFYVDSEHGDRYAVADWLLENSDKVNVGWEYRDKAIKKLENEDLNTLDFFDKVCSIRTSTGKGYIAKPDTMNRNKAQTFKNLDLEVKGSNLCSETNLPANEDYTFNCPIINVNLSLWDSLPEHIFHLVHIMQDCNVSGYLEQIDMKDGYSRLFLSKIYNFTKDFRAVGTGTCGLHSLFMQKRIVVGSLESFQLNNKIFKRMQSDIHEANIWLADVMGVPDGVKRAKLHLRNATTMFSPPTKGSVELTRNTPSEGIGLETALVKVKETVGGNIFRINTAFLDFMKEKGQYNDENVRFVAEQRSCQKCEWMTEEEKKVFRIAFEIPMESHLDLCSQRQKYFDQQQSINLYFASHDTPEYVGEIHKKALLDEGINSLYYCYSSRGGEYERAMCEACM